MIQADPSNRFVLQTDLGQDRIYVSALDAGSGKLSPVAGSPFSVPPGDGPRHFTFHRNGRWLYSLQEEASTVMFFHFDPATGSLSPQQTISTLPRGFKGTNFTAEILLSPDGRFLYVSNRLHDTVGIFSLNHEGRLSSMWAKHPPWATTQGTYKSPLGEPSCMRATNAAMPLHRFALIAIQGSCDSRDNTRG